LTVPLEEADPGVPETLKQLLEMQLQQSSAREQQLLKCASVAGQHLTAWSVATMLAGDSSDLEQTCEALADRQQFLRSSGMRELPDGASTPEYQFRHALYRDVLYRRLGPTLRVAYHRRLAEGLARLHAPVEPEMAAEIALHFEKGHDYGQAVRYLMLAAHNATRRYAHHQSIGVLEHAREILPRVAGERRHELDLQTLERIGNAYYALGDMDASANTYRSMATRAAAAGLLDSQADGLMRQGYHAESIPFFERAVEIDPNFAAAYVSLSRIYSNLGEAERAAEYARLAYERRDHVSTRDRLSITYQFHYEVTGDQSQATRTLEEWKQVFPLEFQPANSLTVIHNFPGNFERAIEEGREAVRRNPSHGYPYSNLAHAYRGIGRFDAARETAERAVALHVETLPTRRLHQLALLDGDEQAAATHVEWARDRPREFDMVGARAPAAGWSGKLRDARQLYHDAARMAELRNLPDVGTSHLAWATSMELAYGNTDAAVQLARRVMARAPSYDPRLRAALALAVAGSDLEAEAIAGDLAAANPGHTLIHAVLVPIVRAGVELARRRAASAIEHLQVIAPYELGFIAALTPVYLRGQAYLMLGAGPQAAAEFQRLLDRRGSDPFSPFHAVALVGLARAHALAGKVGESVTAYERFLGQWQDADPDIPVLVEARAAYCELTRGAASAART
jgi:tetratricopeptide (TPR) repeat protein